MKNVSISVTDQHAAALEAAVASGDYASVSEVVRAALRQFLHDPHRPDERQLLADYEAFRRELASGEGMVSGEEALRQVRDTLKE